MKSLTAFSLAVLSLVLPLAVIAEEPSVSCSIELAQDTFVVAEPIVVQLTLENPCTSEVITHDVSVSTCIHLPLVLREDAD